MLTLKERKKEKRATINIGQNRLQRKSITRNKEGHFIIIKESRGCNGPKHVCT